MCCCCQETLSAPLSQGSAREAVGSSHPTAVWETLHSVACDGALKLRALSQQRALMTGAALRLRLLIHSGLSVKVSYPSWDWNLVSLLVGALPWCLDGDITTGWCVLTWLSRSTRTGRRAAAWRVWCVGQGVETKRITSPCKLPKKGFPGWQKGA